MSSLASIMSIHRRGQRQPSTRLPNLAYVSLDVATLERLLRYIGLARQVRGQEKDANHIDFFDPSIRCLSVWRRDVEDRALWECVSKATDFANQYMLDKSRASSLLDVANAEVEVVRPSVLVSDIGVRWDVTLAEDTAVSYTTEIVARDTLVRALLMTAPESELPRVLEKYASDVPWQVLDLVDGGLRIEGGLGDGTTRTLSHLPEGVMAELLVHADPEIRERAIRCMRTLGPIRRVTR